MKNSISLRVPATSANLGPGFDCLGLALDLWNETTITLTGKEIKVIITGEGAGTIPDGCENLIVRAMLHYYLALGKNVPEGILIECTNRIPLGSGMGSSASAVLAGLIGANALADSRLNTHELLKLAIEMEGHPDNVAASLYGGLTISVNCENGDTLVRRLVPSPRLHAALAVPILHLPTKAARAALPKNVPFCDAIFNIGRTALVVEALRSGDLEMLEEAVKDRLHQPYRLKLIPGAEAALRAARQSGACAAAISGAGPGIIALCDGHTNNIADSMVEAFLKAGVQARPFSLELSETGVQVVPAK
ncbi:MAG: homoserine kinase [Leptolinea sp.]